MKQMMIYSALAVAAALPAATPAVFDFEQGLGKERFDRRYAGIETAAPLSGSRSLAVDTRTSDSEWNGVWSLPKGVLKPGRSYKISLTAKVTDKANDRASLLFLIRPLSANHELSDAGMLTPQTVGKEEKITFRLNVPEKPDDYSLQVHIHFGVRALVDDITVTPIELKEIPAPRQAKAVPLPAVLPTGSEEFTVDRPKKESRKEFNAKEFGVSTASKDNTAALQRAIDTVRRQAPARLFLEPGVYRFEGEKPLIFNALTDFELDGQGAELRFHRTGGDRQLIAVSNSTRLELKNFTVDWDWERDPLASVVTVDSVAPDRRSIRLRFVDYEKFPNTDLRVADLSRIDPANRQADPVRPVRITLEMNKGQNRPEARFLEPNLVELTSRPGMFKSAMPGETFLMRHYGYDFGAFFLRNNQHLTLENVTVASAPGMGVITSGRQHHWQLLNCRIAPPAGSKRPCSTTADAMHTISSAGFFRLENCELAYSCDDTMNFHDLNGYAVKLDENRIMTTNLNSHPGDYFRVGDPIELCNDDFSPTGFTGKITAIKFRNRREGEITFDKPVPEPAGGGFVLLNRSYGSRNLIFRNNHIHHFPRGLLLMAENVTIENNRFEEGNAAGIKLETGYTFDVWSEGYGVRNVVIRNNRFTGVNRRGRYVSENRPDIYINSYLRSDPSLLKSPYPVIRDIWITGNEFRESTGSPVFVSTADNVTISGNRFVNHETVPVKEEKRGLIGAGNSGTVRVLNNVWESSLPGLKSGVLYDPDSVTKLEEGGNVVRSAAGK